MPPESVGQQMALAWARYHEVLSGTAYNGMSRWQMAINIQRRVISAVVGVEQ
ncbi:hypothetical protein [Enterobacter cloacae]|uniref:hypothetical protein n=1 Tax=Enterobacter cloacae TaxID=550 RepID=UPI0012AEDA8D|nr:hypothetical protein [Enterobacter cloacae]